VPIGRFRATRDAIFADIEAHGFNERLQTYTRVFDSDEVDASLLLLPLYGYPAATTRLRTTVDHILRQLAAGPFLYRYPPGEDGLPGSEGAFGIASFWAVEALALGGNLGLAQQRFEQLVACANDVGLLAEEFGVADGEALGNFPQAFTHVGLINAAITLAQASPENLASRTE